MLTHNSLISKIRVKRMPLDEFQKPPSFQAQPGKSVIK